jgi:CDP-glycerol glycerophosphotransferase
LSQIIKFFIAITTLFIPVNKKLYLFGSWLGNKYGDNARYFYEWIVEQDKGINAVWVTKSPVVAAELAAKGLPVVQEQSFASFWMHLRASAVFCNTSHESDLWGVVLNRKVKVFNLWHGTPIKKIGLDAIESNISAEKLGINSRSLLNKILPKTLFQKCKEFANKDTYFLASSETVSGLLQSAMGVSKDKVLIDGYPKLDHLIKSNKNLGAGKILYAPTYRGKYNSENDLLSEFGFDLESTEEWLKEYDKYLTIRLHPANELPSDLIDKLNSSLRINVGGKSDLYESLVDYELVVTDFSSLYFDCLAINIPVMLAPFGLKSYEENDRPLYFSPDQLYPGKLATDWSSLLKNLPDTYQRPVNLQSVKDLFYIEEQGEASSSLLSKVRSILET